MNQRAIVIAVLLFVLIVVGMFVFAYLIKDKGGKEMPTATDSTPGTGFEKPADVSVVKSIDAKHYYIDGVHTIAGTIMAPTACDLLTWNTAGFDEGKRIVVSFDFKNNSGSCERKATPQRFKVGFRAPADATIETNLSGKPVPLNLIPAQEGENPADFELFIKG